MSIRIDEETTSALVDYGRMSIAFTVKSKFVAEPDVNGWKLTEEAVDPPWVKDYDEGEPPTRWLRWDTSNWRLISAFSGNERIGGAIVVYKSPQLDFLEGRDDLAALWDIRVAPEWRGQGVGSLLFEHVVRYARKMGCVELKIETQDVNVGACKFYAKQGCGLAEVTPNAYPGWPDEVEMIWRLDLA